MSTLRVKTMWFLLGIRWSNDLWIKSNLGFLVDFFPLNLALCLYHEFFSLRILCTLKMKESANLNVLRQFPRSYRRLNYSFLNPSENLIFPYQSYQEFNSLQYRRNFLNLRSRSHYCCCFCHKNQGFWEVQLGTHTDCCQWVLSSLSTLIDCSPKKNWPDGLRIHWVEEVSSMLIRGGSFYLKEYAEG